MLLGDFKQEIIMTAIDPKDKLTSKLIDIALIVDFKERFIKLVEETLGIKVLAHLKDYDPGTEISIGVTILEKNVEELIKNL